ncbi:hypothetical protein [Microcoleus vaginatus]
MAIEAALDRFPESYSTKVYQPKGQEVYQQVYESYSEVGCSIYTTAV